MLVHTTMSTERWRRKLVLSVAKQLHESDCSQMRFISSRLLGSRFHCPCRKPHCGGEPKDHLKSLDELRQKGCFSQTNEGLESLAKCLEDVYRIDLANLVREKVSEHARFVADTCYDRCEAAIDECGKILTELSLQLSEWQREKVVEHMRRTVDELSLRVREMADVVPKEESRRGAEGSSRIAMDRDRGGLQDHACAGTPCTDSVTCLRMYGCCSELA